MSENELEVMLKWMSTLGTVNALTYIQQGLVGAINQTIPCDDGLSVRKLTSEEMFKFLVNYLQVGIKELDKKIEEYKKTLDELERIRIK